MLDVRLDDAHLDIDMSETGRSDMLESSYEQRVRLWSCTFDHVRDQ
jgi:hypothetical protein